MNPLLNMTLFLASVNTTEVTNLFKEFLVWGVVIIAGVIILQYFAQKKYKQALFTFIVGAFVYAYLKDPVYFLDRVVEIPRMFVNMFGGGG